MMDAQTTCPFVGTGGSRPGSHSRCGGRQSVRALRAAGGDVLRPRSSTGVRPTTRRSSNSLYVTSSWKELNRADLYAFSTELDSLDRVRGALGTDVERTGVKRDCQEPCTAWPRCGPTMNVTDGDGIPEARSNSLCRRSRVHSGLDDAVDQPNGDFGRPGSEKRTLRRCSQEDSRFGSGVYPEETPAYSDLSMTLPAALLGGS